MIGDISPTPGDTRAERMPTLPEPANYSEPAVVAWIDAHGTHAWLDYGSLAQMVDIAVAITGQAIQRLTEEHDEAAAYATERFRRRLALYMEHFHEHEAYQQWD